jgi:hypothetical protein
MRVLLTLCIVELVSYSPRHFLAEELHPTLCEIPAHIYCVFASNTLPPKQIIFVLITGTYRIYHIFLTLPHALDREVISVGAP